MAPRKYKKGDSLVYPHHGACTVEKIEKMTAFDIKQDYLKLKVAYTDLVLMVPVANAESVGLRDVINDEEVSSFQEPLREVTFGRHLPSCRGGPQPFDSRQGQGSLRRRKANADPGSPDPRL